MTHDDSAGDLFASTSEAADYSAKDIEVLEGLEPVRRRPGMYIGGTDEKALHHLVAEVLDNAMDEAVAGHASRIEIAVEEGDFIRITDNGRGIPTDPHPKFKTKSALEVIFTTLHSGGKFGGKAYATSGGLHGVGVSVVNALSDFLEVEVARNKHAWRQEYSRGLAKTKLEDLGAVSNKRGTTVRFHPDPEIFGETTKFNPKTLYKMARSKAYLFRGVEIRWSCADSLLGKDSEIPPEDKFHFPGGLLDFLNQQINPEKMVTPTPFSGQTKLADGGRLEWAIAWPTDREGFIASYCNTVPTPEGGTHEAGMRAALAKGLRAYGELASNRRAGMITAEDVLGNIAAVLSIFIREPQFQGQTKEKLSSPEAAKQAEAALRDHFDHWLSGAPEAADRLLAYAILRAEERQRRKHENEVSRKSATRKLRLPGKLADCSQSGAGGTELFIVEGDSAGGSAKQARNRATQAVLPLRGKILNVASAGQDRLAANQELKDLIQALGCGIGDKFHEDDLRYEKIIIMTDADVDGAHIATLLMTFFYRTLPGLIKAGRLYIAQPPLYRLSLKGKTLYAIDDSHKDILMEREFGNAEKVEVSRFKGLGEMPPAQLKATTMNPENRSLLRVIVPEDFKAAEETSDLVERLMGKRPELRFEYIQAHADKVGDLDI